MRDAKRERSPHLHFRARDAGRFRTRVRADDRHADRGCYIVFLNIALPCPRRLRRALFVQIPAISAIDITSRDVFSPRPPLGRLRRSRSIAISRSLC